MMMMPLYEYQCESCGQRFEVIQKFSDPPVECCRVCRGPVKKLLSSPAIQFKGSGFYITDYARKSGEKGSPASDSSSPSSSSSSSSSPESPSAGKESPSASPAARPTGASSKDS